MVAAIIIAVVIFLIVIMAVGYVKAAPDKAIIISGFRKKKKILIGKAGIKIPFLERKDTLSLQLIPIDVKTAQAVPTADYINIMVDAVVNVQVDTAPERLELAAQNFLNKKTEDIGRVAREVLEGNMREIVGTMRLEQMVSDRQTFAERVKENADPDISAMGLRIVSFNVQNFMDNDHVIENLGVDNVVKISKAAAISRAESERDIAIARAEAQQKSNEAEVASRTAIAQKENELEIKKAQLKVEADTQKAIADAAYEIQQEQQRKTIEVTKTEADIARSEKQAILKEKEATVAEQELTATIRKQADADKYKKQQEAEAALIEQRNIAEAEKAKAEAALYAKQKEAEGIAAVGRAEAEAIAAKGKAEAEAMEKKAEAYAKYNNAAITEMIIKQLPEIAKAIAEPISAIDKVTVIDSGNGESGVAQVGGYTPAVLAKVIESIKETTGFDLTEVMKADTYAAKTDKNISVSGLEGLDTVNVTIQQNGDAHENPDCH